MAFRRRRAARTDDFAVYDAARDAAWVIVERLRLGLDPVAAADLPTPTVQLVAGETQLTAPVVVTVFRWHHPEAAPGRPAPASVPAWTAGQAVAARRALDARERQWRAAVADAVGAYWDPYGGNRGALPVVATTHRIVIGGPHPVSLWWQHITAARPGESIAGLVLTVGADDGWWLTDDPLPPITALALWFARRQLLDVTPATDRTVARHHINREAGQRIADALGSSTG